jgi:phosphate-selective porin OprO/OprP
LGYDFKELLRARKARLGLDYVYNEPDRDSSWTRNLQHVASLNFRYEAARWGVRTDLAGGIGSLGASDAWGTLLMPFYNLTDRLQLVARYTHIESKEAHGLRLALYENQVVPGRGDRYDEFYLGLNYYVYGHKLKLQTGVQHAEMKDEAGDSGDYSGWAWTTGLRISW